MAGAPVDGKANRELVRFLAQTLQVPQGNVVVVRGATGRRKTVAVQGVDPDRAGKLLGLQATH